MDKTVCAVLLDTVSIQEYVFSSNRLKENLGASCIVKRIFKEDLINALMKTFDNNDYIDEWEINPDRILLLDNLNIDYEIGFSGGGKALLFFKNKEAGKLFIKAWTNGLIRNAPGLQTAVSIMEKFHLENKFSEDLEALFMQLVVNKNCYFPSVSFEGQGITRVCSLSGKTVQVYREFPDSKPLYISIEAAARLEAAQDEEKQMEEQYESEIYKHNMAFSSRLDELGQIKGRENHIAVVHIDGNGMGERFTRCKDLVSYRRLSLMMRKTVDEAFRSLLEYVRHDLMPELGREQNDFKIYKDKKERELLPLRPIIIAGDDVTFVTEGRLGIHLAEKMIEFWTQHRDFADIDFDFSACAGVAIIKTKYPFYRGYKMAEELCGIAKKQAREKQGTSWLDYHVANDSPLTSIESLKKQDEGKDLQLHFSPYLLTDDEGEKSFSAFKKGMQEMCDEKKWPQSKIKQFRTALSHGETETKRFVQQLQARKRYLPFYDGNYGREGHCNGKTPYADMINILEYYPQFLLKGGIQLVKNGH